MLWNAVKEMHLKSAKTNKEYLGKHIMILGRLQLWFVAYFQDRSRMGTPGIGSVENMEKAGLQSDVWHRKGGICDWGSKVYAFHCKFSEAISSC